MSDATSDRLAWLTPDSAPTSTRCRRVRVPDSEAWIAIVSGALLPLIDPENWEQFGALTPEEAADRAKEMFLRYLADEDCRIMIGAIFPYVTSEPPFGCLSCDGGIYSRVDYPDLYATIAPEYRIDADFFAVPDLRGQTVIGASADRPFASTGGEETHTLTTDEMPEHIHSTDDHAHTTQPHDHSTMPHNHTFWQYIINLDVEAPGVPDPLGAGNPQLPAWTDGATVTVNPANVTVNPANVTVNTSGGGAAHNNMQPYTALRYCVVAK